MATPSLAMIPSAYADSKVYSVLPNNGDGDFTFNRDSSATRVGQNGLIQTVGFFGNELITNGSFDTDSDWTKNSWTISNGKANSGSTSSLLEQLNVYTSTSIIYKTVIKARSVNGSSVTLRVYDGSGNNYETLTITSSSFQEFTIERARAGNSSTLFFYNDSNAQIEIDNVSVKEVTGDQPRLNYDISNGVVQSCPSLLLEPASTNLITYSSDFSNSAWTKDNLTITSNSVISPDGSLNATKIIATTANGIHKLRQNLSTVTGTYTQSIFAKKGEYKNILVWDDTTSGGIGVNLDNLSIFRNQNNLGHKIENYGNEWVRISVTRSFSSQQMLPAIYMYDNSATPQISFAGNGVDGFYIFGAQVEEQSYATSLIPTNGASQTRAAETCLNAGTASTFNSTEGVLYAEIKALSQTGGNRYISLSNGTDLNRILLRFQDTDKVGCYVRSTSGSDADITKNSASISSSFLKVAVKWKTNDVALWVNGVEIGVDSSFTTFNANVLDRLNFAGTSGTNQYFYGNVKDIRVYNEALTDAQLQTLTTL